jgi:hypothetical protein
MFEQQYKLKWPADKWTWHDLTNLPMVTPSAWNNKKGQNRII